MAFEASDGIATLVSTRDAAPLSLDARRGENSNAGLVRRRLDPRVSLAILLLLNLIAFAPTEPWTEIAAVLLCAATMAWCGRGVAAARWVAAYAFLYAVSWGLVGISTAVAASFATMFVMMRRIYCVGMFASNMIATTRVGEMAAALQSMRVPRGGVVAISVALRFFPTMGKEFKAVSEAMRVRGIAITPLSVIRRPLGTMENLMVPVMSRLAIVVDELSNAAVVRGIDSDVKRTSYYRLRLSAADALALIGFGFVAVYVAGLKLGVVL